MKRRDLIKALEAYGYSILREGSEHTVFHKPGNPVLTIPRHKEVNENTAKQILKDARKP